MPHLKTDNMEVNTAYYTAVSDLVANIKPYKGGLLKKEQLVMIAGIGYYTPWTRDGAINTMNAGALMFPKISENTLLSVVNRSENGSLITDNSFGQYWDSIIWVLGAWEQYIFTLNKDFLSLAYEVTENAIKYYEKTEFDSKLNLFRGPACYGDGISAYPDFYSCGSSGILEFAQKRKDELCKNGVGIPMFTLSTNCLYYRAYKIADIMAKELGKEEKIF